MSLRRMDLEPARDLKAVFGDIRNYLAGNAAGMTRDEALASELINILFCKLYDENHTRPKDEVRFRALEKETPQSVKKRLDGLFSEVRTEYGDVYARDESIALDARSVSYVVRKLQGLCLGSASREAIGEAFEVFIGPALRGGEGQFFTPRSVVDMTVDMLDPRPGERIIDPACGSGGFLTVALQRVKEKETAAPVMIAGIDKDGFLAKLTRVYLALMGGEKGSVRCENSLEDPKTWSPESRADAPLGAFDVVLTNPPFGASIPVSGRSTLSQYELGHWWHRPKDRWVRTGALLDSQPPQILFIERCLQLLRPGGRMGIVLPDGIFSNTSDGYIREFILSHCRLLAVVDVPSEAFQPSTATKTSVLFVEKTKGQPKDDYQIFMSVVKECGHDKRGRENCNDELGLAAQRYREWTKGGTRKGFDRLGFAVSLSDVRRTGELILTPKYYDPGLGVRLGRMEKSGKFEFLTISDLVRDGVLSIKRGNEIGSRAYGLGEIPFIRTSDISNWEIRINPETCVDEEVYRKYSKAQDLRPEDILFVNDGGRMVGEAAIITPHDGRMLIQSHIRRIRVLKRDVLDPFLLLYLLRLPVVRDQMESKRFVQATIPSLGNRLLEVVLPVPKSAKTRDELSARTRRLVLQRAELLREMADYTGRDL